MGDFENCPKQYYHKRIAKDVVDVQGEAASWGDRVHKFFEYSIMNYQGLPLDAIQTTMVLQGRESEFLTYQPWLDFIFTIPCDKLIAEQQLAINKQLVPCDWFAKDVWCRGIIDVLIIQGDRARALDWKTGKRKPNSRQLKLFALLVFIHYPEVMTCKTDFLWLKTNERDSETFTRAQEPELWQEFLPSLAKYNAAFKAEIFPPRKSGLCRGWCPVTSCEYWEPKR